MIIKLKAPFDGKWYRRKSCVLVHTHTPSECLAKAARIDEHFLYETVAGWYQGDKGFWIIELGENARISLDDHAFKALYEPLIERDQSTQGT